MDKCSQFTDKLSAYIDNELSSSELDELDRHIGSCDLCQNEIQALKSTKHTLKSLLPKIEPANKSRERILKRVFEEAVEKGRVVSFRRRNTLLYKGMALAASILLLIFISRTDTTSSPMKLYVLEHQKCMTEGHRDYLCKTEHELSQKIENSMGVKSFIPTYFPEGFKFIKGDVCNIKGATVAHMVMSDGKNILSYFQGKDVKSPLTPPFSKGGHGGINAGKLENYKYAHWKKDGVYCIVVGDIDEKEMLRIASSQKE
ncbi:MAG: zf-HC2 domain-containing protein [Nitrospinae bacterium]|nr:zf-HC2 domain-containing protein [Nitrospinota bacterium]